MACLLFWVNGWNPALAGSLNLQPRAAIGNAEVSEPPAVSSAAAENNAVPAVAAPDPASPGAEQNGSNEANSALPTADQQPAQQSELQSGPQTIQQAGADSIVQPLTDADSAEQPPSPESSQQAGKPDS
ncbi:hypothetical protein, partial [Desulfovibrio sp.]|uniref:hypothetical protein n=1 Tax=Desulfovibrio sp. TaxID=885 RepID=UPI002601B00B